MTDQGSRHSVKIEEMSLASPLFLNIPGTQFPTIRVPPAERRRSRKLLSLTFSGPIPLLTIPGHSYYYATSNISHFESFLRNGEHVHWFGTTFVESDCENYRVENICTILKFFYIVYFSLRCYFPCITIHENIPVSENFFLHCCGDFLLQHVHVRKFATCFLSSNGFRNIPQSFAFYLSQLIRKRPCINVGCTSQSRAKPGWTCFQD